MTVEEISNHQESRVKVCSIPQCGKKAAARGWCHMHYSRWKTHGNPMPGLLPLTQRPRAICSIEGCGGEVDSRNLCSKHYLRLKRNGDPLLTKRTPNGDPMRFIAEYVMPYDGDECVIWPYAKGSNGYGQIFVDGKLHIVTRIICEMVHGPAPDDIHEAAHSCGKCSDGCVTKTHLRLATPQENNADKIGHGTHLIGQDAPTAKLKNEQVTEIRKLFRLGRRNGDLSEQFNIARSTISQIVYRKSWRHLNDGG